MNKWVVIGGVLVLAVGAYALTRNKGAAAATTGTKALTSAQLAQIMADTQAKLDNAAKLAASGNYAAASKAAQDAATLAFNAGNIDASSKAAITAASYADQASQVAAAQAGLVADVYVPATPATIAANVSTAFEIANSGLGGSVAIGKTITVKGVDGTKTFINTGNGYAEYTPAYQSAMSVVSSKSITEIKTALINKGFATSEQLAAMSDAQLKAYAGSVYANSTSLFQNVPATSTYTAQVLPAPVAVVPIATPAQVIAVQQEVSTWSPEWQNWYYGV